MKQHLTPWVPRQELRSSPLFFPFGTSTYSPHGFHVDVAIRKGWGCCSDKQSPRSSTACPHTLPVVTGRGGGSSTTLSPREVPWMIIISVSPKVLWLEGTPFLHSPPFYWPKQSSWPPLRQRPGGCLSSCVPEGGPDNGDLIREDSDLRLPTSLSTVTGPVS